MLRALVISSLLVVAACVKNEPAPELRALPTLAVLPSVTPVPPTPTSTPTRAPTATNTPTDVPPTLTDTPTPTEITLTEIVVAVQPIPAGTVIPAEAVALKPFPENSAPFGAVTGIEDVVGSMALTEVFCFEPLLAETIAAPALEPSEPDSEIETQTPSSDCGPYPYTPEQTDFVDVVFVIRSIDAGETIMPDMVALVPWPEALAPPDALHTLGDAIGSVAQVDLYREQLVVARRLAGQDER